MTEDRLQDLYLEASGLDAGGRRRLLDSVAIDFPDLLADLERLLRHGAEQPSPIDGSPWRLPNSAPAGPPERVGRFRLLRELGRGGMGRVYLAEEETEDFRRTVALKLIDRPGPEGEAVRRFRDEVRILASLEHPGIARFLDGGRSPEGIWYLALELVDGRNLVEHAHEAGLTVAGRTALFLDVVDAVAYAHRRGVVHRDLKPANVLVGSDGRPRLLDFGISKLVGGDDEHDAATLTDWRPLTPAYASPEQFRGERVTTRSDVWSLGVLLYELIAGARPFASAGSSSGALERAVLESDPEPPSAALRKARRATDPDGGRPTRPAPRGEIRRDLDAICLKALRRRPAERYESAEALAADLRRMLAGQGVEAPRPRPRAPWRLVHWSAATAVAGLLLVGGFALLGRSGDGTAPATSSAAETGNRFFPFDPVNPPPAEESERRFAESPEDRVAGAALVVRLGRERRFDEGRIVLGRLRQVPGADDDPLVDFAAGDLARRAGEHQKALIFFTHARERALAQGRSDLVGTILLARGGTLVTLGQRDTGFAELEAARAELERAGDHRALYRALNELAILSFQQGELDRGEALFEAAVDSARRVGFEPVIVLTNLAEVKFLRGRPDLAEPLARQSLEGLRRYPDPARASDGLTRLALIVRDLGRAEEAATCLEEALALVRASPTSTALGTALHTQALFDLESARLDRLEGFVAELERLAEASLQRRPLGFARSVAGRRAAVRGDLDRAREAFTEARQIFVAQGERDLAALSDLAWAEAEARDGDAAAAARILDEALAGLDEAQTTFAGYFAETLRVRLDVRERRLTEASRRLAELGGDGERAPSVGRRLAYLGARAALARASGHADDARADLESALALARRSGRRSDELELRLELARFAPDAAAARTRRADLAREARSLGLEALAARAAG